jgi:hypothetical protein
MEATTAGVTIVGPNDAKEGFLGSIGVRSLIDGAEAGVASQVPGKLRGRSSAGV